MIKHLACIMDGNRRWAKRKGWKAFLGHRYGVSSVETTIAFCLEKEIPFLSLYAFSLENFQRSYEETSYLFKLIIEQAEKNLPLFLKENIRVRFIGDTSLFPDSVKPYCTMIEEKTADNNRLFLSFLFYYGGKQELVATIKTLVKKCGEGTLSSDALSDQIIEQHLWTSELPDPDIILRTSGVQRLSNFFLYRAGYSELFFIDCLWPDLKKEDLETVIQQFLQRKRRFGI